MSVENTKLIDEWNRLGRWTGGVYLLKNAGIFDRINGYGSTGNSCHGMSPCRCKVISNSRIQMAATRGYNIIPTAKLQKYVKSIDLRSAVEDNVAFKLSFGATFMLAAFAEF